MDIDGKPFSDVLGEVESGQVLRDLTDAAYEVVNAALATRKPGTITLTMKFSPTGRGSVEVDAAIAKKVPEHDRPSTIFFTTNDGTLVRDDPGQPKLPLREVDIPRNKPVDVGR